MGTEEQWFYLAASTTRDGASIQSAILNALNLLTFDPHRVLGGWKTADNNVKWLFWLWYHLGLNHQSDYISYAVLTAKTYREIEHTLEIDILSCSDNPYFDEWVEQRNVVMAELGVSSFSKMFWDMFNAMPEDRKKLKLLSGNTHDERVKIIEVISHALRNGKTIRDFKTVLQEKYPDLYTYLAYSEYGKEDVQSYFNRYKVLKVKDEFSLSLSEAAEKINFYDYESRGALLNKIKTTSSAYYLWVDGMGIEWLDLLVRKIAEADSSLVKPKVAIGTAILPTITSDNMAIADPDTVSIKLNDLDALGHIKDKSDCNYYSIIAKQLEKIGAIAQDVIAIMSEHPDLDIVITADHGMSRMAAKAFHKTEGVNLQKNAKVCGLGRYCKVEKTASPLSISHTIKDGDIIAFRTHGHFTASGYAPGEIHGGATPEEILVPVILYKHTSTSLKQLNTQCSYTLDSTVFLQPSGNCTLNIKTTGAVAKVTIEVCSKRISAKKINEDSWAADIEGLNANNDYTVRVYLNNIFTDKVETIYVKNRGISMDDDFDF